MKTVVYRDESIIIEEEKRKLLSKKLVTKTTEILLDDIGEVSRDEYKGKLNSITILIKNKFGESKTEQFITLDEYPDLENLYDFLVRKKEAGKNYKISTFDIGTIL